MQVETANEGKKGQKPLLGSIKSSKNVHTLEHFILRSLQKTGYLFSEPDVAHPSVSKSSERPFQYTYAALQHP